MKNQPEPRVCTLNINLHVTVHELNELKSRINAENVNTENYIKRAICGFTAGTLFSGDDVWGGKL